MWLTQLWRSASRLCALRWMRWARCTRRVGGWWAERLVAGAAASTTAMPLLPAADPHGCGAAPLPASTFVQPLHVSASHLTCRPGAGGNHALLRADQPPWHLGRELARLPGAGRVQHCGHQLPAVTRLAPCAPAVRGLAGKAHLAEVGTLCNAILLANASLLFCFLLPSCRRSAVAVLQTVLDKKASGRLCRCVEDAHSGMSPGVPAGGQQASRHGGSCDTVLTAAPPGLSSLPAAHCVPHLLHSLLQAPRKRYTAPWPACGP